MSHITFYRVLLWLPIIVPMLVAPLWLVPGAGESAVTGPFLYILTYGALYAAVPYAALALRVDHWLRSKPHPGPTAIWRRAMTLPVQFVLFFALWQLAGGIVSLLASGGPVSAENVIAAGLSGALWVVIMGYAYVGLACGVTRLAAWAGCVRAPTQTPAT